VRHLRIAYASVKEAEALIDVAADLGYLAPDQAGDVLARAHEVTRMLGGLIRRIRSRS
jgi:four helix bundle protein